MKKLQAAAPQHGQIASIDLRLPLNVTSLQTAIAGIRDTTVPKPPCFHALLQANKKWTTADMDDVLSRTQKYISGLGYNHLGEAFFDVTKSAGASRIMVLAKEIIHQSLPIKCLEAVVVAAYLTMGIQALDRIPLAFESQAGGNTYRHIVLVVRHRPRPGQSLWGALGLSRRKTLMDKPCHYEVCFEALFVAYVLSSDTCLVVGVAGVGLQGEL